MGNTLLKYFVTKNSPRNMKRKSRLSNSFFHTSDVFQRSENFNADLSRIKNEYTNLCLTYFPINAMRVSGMLYTISNKMVSKYEY